MLQTNQPNAIMPMMGSKQIKTCIPLGFHIKKTQNSCGLFVTHWFLHWFIWGLFKIVFKIDGPHSDTKSLAWVLERLPYMEHHGFSSVPIPTWPRIRRGLLCPAGPKPGPGPYEDGKGFYRDFLVILLGINKDRTDWTNMNQQSMRMVGFLGVQLDFFMGIIC